jgi:hypothetical protein
VLAIVTASAIALSLGGRGVPSQTSAAGPSGHGHASTSGRSSRHAKTTVPAATGGAGTRKSTAGRPAVGGHQAGSPPTTGAATAGQPGSVVLGYFAAIDQRNWQLAWQLGGQRLYPSYVAMLSALTGAGPDAVSIVGVTGYSVVAQVTTVTALGITVVRKDSFLVQGGQIVSAPTLTASTRSG